MGRRRKCRNKVAAQRSKDDGDGVAAKKSVSEGPVGFHLVLTDPCVPNGFAAWPIPETGLVLGFKKGMFHKPGSRYFKLRAFVSVDLKIPFFSAICQDATR